MTKEVKYVVVKSAAGSLVPYSIAVVYNRNRDIHNEVDTEFNDGFRLVYKRRTNASEGTHSHPSVRVIKKE